MSPCSRGGVPVIVLMTVREAGAGSYWLVSVAVAEPPAGIVTVIGSDGVVVTSMRRACRRRPARR